MSLRIGGALKELRIHLCQTSKNAEGVRNFLIKNYVNIKKANPDFPILIRECKGIQPRVWARYDRAQEMSKNLSSLTEAEVAECLQELAECSGPC
ncbi:NADH dehydrogenase [ubiquinone] 1 alpha subcomplex subunit 2 isoform X1 [Hyposmocoma kahamanoa]|uniref:NADH dehydrogenase [ubiquinone] 1 alpha subcomplex subunit 2 isoform X1 n=1 Tax=Hyposmocoma kahamanoa TaxID=1477025 RepID=UPI000E6D995C|nr:NADH dehydrogenase [ubiquinone] 1 alpha subcomplex subunit 2 isoform X1 [Hyposmocoma kahamanoa]